MLRLLSRPSRSGRRTGGTAARRGRGSSAALTRHCSGYDGVGDWNVVDMQI